MTAAFVGEEAQIVRVFESRRRETIEAILSTRGMPLLTERPLDAMPRLRAVRYAAGDVRGFA